MKFSEEELQTIKDAMLSQADSIAGFSIKVDWTKVLAELTKPAHGFKEGQEVVLLASTKTFKWNNSMMSNLFRRLTPEEMGIERFKKVSGPGTHIEGWNDAIDHVNKILGFE